MSNITCLLTWFVDQLNKQKKIMRRSLIMYYTSSFTWIFLAIEFSKKYKDSYKFEQCLITVKYLENMRTSEF
jgi:hypothetical protein